MRKIAIIPARGGSKRIPRKNIKDFLGKPIIAYSIEAALASNLFEEVMVSTEDEEIAEIAKKYGAKVPFRRSAKNADDFATTVDVLLEVWKQYEEKGIPFEKGCCIYPTAPFVSPKRLIEGYDLLSKGDFNSVFPVLPFSFPIQRSLKIDESKTMKMFYPKYMNTRSQDLEPAYHDSGQFYWFNWQAILQQKKIYTKKTGVIILSEMEAQDIDNETDWKLAELKYQILNG